jgi:hypothetical protein
LDGKLFVAYQNGVGAKGEPSKTGAKDSTVVEYTPWGQKLAQWNLTGKVDGLSADPTRHFVVATVNEDGNSSLYTITPGGDWHDDSGAGTVKHYQYSPNPLPHGGGTDSIAVRHGVLYITASAPAANADGTTYSAPALYKVTLDDTTAKVSSVLQDDSTATDAVTGKSVTLNLSDPDSSENVPHSVPRFGGDLLLDSQGDSQLIFLKHVGNHTQTATVLNLNTQVDDTAFATTGWCGSGTLYVVDSGKGNLIAIRGDFRSGQAFTSVPKDSTTLPATLGGLDLKTGQVTPFATGMGNPKGLLFVPDSSWFFGDDQQHSGEE